MTPYLPVLITALSIFVPTFLALGFLVGYRKWQSREGRRDPLHQRRIYGAGEQLRKRVEESGDNMLGGLTALFFLGPYFLAVWALQFVPWERVAFRWSHALFIAAFLLMAAWAIRMIVRNGAERRRALAGLRAEMYTAQELNRLAGAGCTVLHDVPGDGFNLDHVVIGPRAVYLVETKSVRKPPDRGTKDHYKVVFDGDALRFPDFVSRSPIRQAVRQAKWLSGYLREALGRQVPVVPTLALPGWYIESGRPSGDSNVRVFNPSGRGAMFMADDRAGKSIERDTAGLIAQALVLRYPVNEK